MILQAILSYLPAKKADSLKKRLLHAKHSILPRFISFNPLRKSSRADRKVISIMYRIPLPIGTVSYTRALSFQILP